MGWYMEIINIGQYLNKNYEDEYVRLKKIKWSKGWLGIYSRIVTWYKREGK